mgnify:CR=1 FL=1
MGAAGTGLAAAWWARLNDPALVVLVGVSVLAWLLGRRSWFAKWIRGPLQAIALAAGDGDYDAATGTLMDVLAASPADAKRVLIAGHNPGLESLVQTLCRHRVPMPDDWKLMPTAALAHLAIPTSWAELDGGTAELLSQPWAVARGGPSRSSVSVPRAKSSASLCRLVPIWMSTAQARVIAKVSSSTAASRDHASTAPTTTGTTAIVSVRGRMPIQNRLWTDGLESSAWRSVTW